MLEFSAQLEAKIALQRLNDSTDHVAKMLDSGRSLDFNARMLRDLFSGSSECIFLKDRSKRIVFSNASFDRQFSSQVDSPLGLTGKKFLPENMQELSRHSDEALTQGCQRIKLEYEVHKPDGSSMNAATMKLPLRGKDGRLNGILGLSQPFLIRSSTADRTDLQQWSRVVTQMREEERQVIKLACNGIPNKTIARRLETSTRTIENRRRRILKKLELESTACLIKLMVRLEDAGLVNLGI